MHRGRGSVFALVFSIFASASPHSTYACRHELVEEGHAAELGAERIQQVRDFFSKQTNFPSRLRALMMSSRWAHRYEAPDKRYHSIFQYPSGEVAEGDSLEYLGETDARVVVAYKTKQITISLIWIALRSGSDRQRLSSSQTRSGISKGLLDLFTSLGVEIALLYGRRPDASEVVIKMPELENHEQLELARALGFQSSGDPDLPELTLKIQLIP